jgi:IS30 family transposase
LVRCRRIAIARLKAAGFSNRGISRAMKRNYSTIQYWTKPKYREKRREYCRNYMAERMAA